MPAENEGEPHVYSIGKASVDKAIELLQSKIKNKRRQVDKTKERDRRIMYHCTNMPTHKKCNSMHVASLSKSLVMSQIRSNLINHEWKHVQNLFYLLPDCRNDVEQLVWRYALICVLYSPYSDSSNLDEFLRQCIGSHDTNYTEELQRLLLLNNTHELT